VSDLELRAGDRLGSPSPPLALSLLADPSSSLLTARSASPTARCHPLADRWRAEIALDLGSATPRRSARDDSSGRLPRVP
jgi:hypothetical protein